MPRTSVCTREPASTERLRAAARLEIRPLDTDSVRDAFVQCAAHLRDADASCVALAGVLGLPLMTDDGKERRGAHEMFPELEIVSTLSLLREAMQRLALSERAQRRLVADLRWGGNFLPPRRDPLSGWYADLLRRAGVPG